jgi:hypothetical protein
MPKISKKPPKPFPKTTKPELMTNEDLLHELTFINEKMFSEGQVIAKEVMLRLFLDYCCRRIG